MPRPTIDHLFDYRVRIWRRTETRGADLRELNISLLPVGPDPVGFNAAANRPTAPLGDPGAGLTPIGTRRFYMRPDVDVIPTDILEILEGPDLQFLPRTWEVDQPPSRPRNHHTQLDTRQWSGTLPVQS